MRVISYGGCRVDVGLCNLRCPYCVHLSEETEEVDVERIARALKGCRHVYVGGAEPTVHGDLVDLLRLLKENGSEVTLKTNGLLPRRVEETLPFVDRYVFELKGDFDDVRSVALLSGLSEERARRYVESLMKSIEIARSAGKKIRIWFRAIPEYIDENRFRKMMDRIGKVDEVLVYQFLSKPEWDKPFDDAEMPSYEFVRRLGEIAREYADRVIIVGERREEL
ncbi:MAG: radical SAM protein [Archaeoglobi archaeon]|nr:radical SAM protein [Archaeoglobi archaeon]